MARHNPMQVGGMIRAGAHLLLPVDDVADVGFGESKENCQEMTCNAR
jgi:hypothetical protein